MNIKIKTKKKQLVWCEDCNKKFSDKTRHFQSENHVLNNQNRQQNNFVQDNKVEIIVNEKTYMKLNINPTALRYICRNELARTC